uniref:Uncharacterized protein n=1 Tax=Rhizophora mucronata TaxID=61149 RepID=A0A2P2PRJ8_RHIMU
MNDRKSQRSKELATFLFDDDCQQDSNLEEMECEEGEFQGTCTNSPSTGTFLN